MEGSNRTCEDTEDTTTLVQIEELKCSIRKLSYATKLSPVRTVNGMGPGWQVLLSCSRCQEYDNCPKKQDSSPTLTAVTGTDASGTSIQGQFVVSVVTTLRDVRSPGDEQLQGTDKATYFKSKENLNEVGGVQGNQVLRRGQRLHR
jgi:hypothetical protein